MVSHCDKIKRISKIKASVFISSYSRFIVWDNRSDKCNFCKCNSCKYVAVDTWLMRFVLTLLVYIQKRITEGGTFQLRINIDRLCSFRASSRAGTYLHVGDTGIPILRTASCAPAALLSFQFCFDAQSLHLIHLADRLPEVFHEFTSVVLVSSVKCD